MRQRLSLVAWIGIFAGLMMFFLNSCKENTILNADILPSSDTADVIFIPDTLTILTRTVVDDSIVTSSSISGIPIYHAAGAVNDPYAGRTTTGFYLQFVPPSLGFEFPTTPDSAVLILPQAFIWGDTSTSAPAQTFRVYEIASSDSIVRDSTYYNFSRTEVSFPAIGSALVTPDVKDSLTILGEKRAPHLRIRLSQTFLDRLVNETRNGDALKSYAGFLSFFRGIYIGTSDSLSGQTLYYFLLNGGSDFTRANIQFYYTEEKPEGDGDTTKYVAFNFDQTRNAHYNAISHDYSGTPVAGLLASGQPSDSLVVLQSEPGVALDLKIPNIKNLPKMPIARAELIITEYKVPGSAAEKYTPPNRLYPVGVKDDGTVYTLADRFPVSSTEPLLFMDGERNQVTVNGQSYARYRINIPREVQQAIMEERDTLHLRIMGTATYPGAYRLILGGRPLSDEDLKIQLLIYFSKI